jgi:C-terminal processing protease CtpA/Prc
VCVSRFFQRFVFVLSVAIFAALGTGFLFGEFGWFGVHAGGQQDGAYRQMNIFRQVLSKIQTEYVTEPNINDVTTGALHGLLESLDADSSYLTPAEYKIYKERPVTGVAQLGITVSKRYGYAIVVSVLPGSPADKEHIADGDVIESIGDQSTRELSLEVIRLLLEGKPGTTVALSVVRPRKPDPDKLTLTRSITGVPALAEFLTDAPLAVIVNRGTAGPAELAAAAIQDLKRGDVVGERTFGQGSVQKTIELPDGAALLLTVAKYQTPGGKKIPDEAVTPAVAVGQTSEEEYEEAPPAKGDALLDKALQMLKANNGDHAALPAVEAAPVASATATPPPTPPAIEKKPGFFRRLFGTK